MAEETEERFTNLEIKLAYLEDFLNQLQAEAVSQSEEIEKLKKENKVLKEKLIDLASNTEEDIPNRKPPHY